MSQRNLEKKTEEMMSVPFTKNLNNTYLFMVMRQTFEFFHRSETMSDVFSV